jgi:DNA repair protein RadC
MSTEKKLSEPTDSNSESGHGWSAGEAPESSPLKYLHDSLKPREELECLGRSNLSDAALIAVLLRSGIKGKNVINLARHILADFDGLVNLAQADHNELIQHRIPGLGRVKAMELSVAMELGLRIAKRCQQNQVNLKIESPHDAYNALNPLTVELKQEKFWVLLLDTKNQLIRNPVEVTTGLIDSTPVHPREIFTEAIRYRAKSIILAHNHPSGDPTPSSQDIVITRRMIDAAKLLDIPIRDHIIMGRAYSDPPVFTSIREMGVVLFND